MTYAVLMALFASASASIGLPEGLVAAVCKVESGYDVRAVNADDGGSPSVGVCQVKPETARFLGFRGTDKELLRPSVNIEYAARYLRYQLNRYHGDVHKAVSAYNMGTYAVDDRGRTVNRRYVRKVMEVRNCLQSSSRYLARSGLSE